ncbi:Uncharacterized response regulatory protein SA0215 [uncultured Clostridium sp.]|uniref:response regulator n=1 Tax=uncultured Clostridium sp. TaxID=59620 RepID=UPI0008204EEC|nr:response regulator [uncultured Clostridium sp.]SCK04203.1 Uncharacterized response regulatory protein SA0215 [uncultured Clostridium sp.]
MVKVLIVDDEVPIRQWLELNVNKIEGFITVGAAANGVEGLELFKETKPDIIITDIRMPGMDGLKMLEDIREIKQSVYGIMLTSHEDFYYARQSISLGVAEYILKTEISVESLKKSLIKGKKKLLENTKYFDDKTKDNIIYRNQYISSIVNGKQEKETSEDKLCELGIDILGRNYFVVNILNKDNYKIDYKYLIKDEDVDNSMIISISHNSVIIINILKASQGISIYDNFKFLNRFCSNLVKETKCIVGSSNIYSGVENFDKAIIESNLALKYSFYNKVKMVYMISEEVKYKLEDSEKVKIKFSNELLNGSYDKLISLIYKSIDIIEKEKPIDQYEIKSLFTYFITSLMYFIEKDDINLESKIKIIKQKIEESMYFEDLKSIINSAIEECNKYLSDKKSYSSAVRKAIKYMEEYYREAISLTEVADYVSLSSEYLSKIFKEETGVKFVVYLNNLRLKEAVNLLEQTNLKVYEIAEKVGYSNMSYFSTVFKKNFGKNPFEYRNK